jgi:hypothetical protein
MSPSYHFPPHHFGSHLERSPHSLNGSQLVDSEIHYQPLQHDTHARFQAGGGLTLSQYESDTINDHALVSVLSSGGLIYGRDHFSECSGGGLLS